MTTVANAIGQKIALLEAAIQQTKDDANARIAALTILRDSYRQQLVTFAPWKDEDAVTVAGKITADIKAAVADDADAKVSAVVSPAKAARLNG